MPLPFPAETRLAQALRYLFLAQGREVMGRLSLTHLEHGLVPDLTHWVPVMVAVLKPLLLSYFQYGMLKTRGRLTPRAPAVWGQRRFVLSPREMFGSAKVLTGVSAVVERHGPRSVSFLRHGPRSVAFLKKVPSPPQGLTVALSYKFDLFNPKVLDAVDQAALAFCRSTLNTATRDLQTALDDLRTALKAGLERGEAVTTLARRVQHVFADPYRALRIAVTESSRATHLGQDLAAREAGATKKAWIASADACDFCHSLADKGELDLDEPYAIVDRGPYGKIMHPPAHPFCYCTQEETYG